MLRPSIRQLRLALLVLLPLPGAAQQVAEPPEDAEPVRRYALEFILFRYDASTSSGTEIFPPEEPEAPGDPETGMDEADGEVVFGDAASLPGVSGPDGRPSFGAEDGAAGIEAGPGDVIEAPGSMDDDERPAYLDMELEEIVTDSARIELEVIPQDLLTMTAEHEKLLLLDAYEPILWSGWTQVVLEQDGSPAIDLLRLGPVPLDFEGSLTLYLGRFVHLVVDVALKETTAVGDAYYGDGENYGNRRDFRDRRQRGSRQRDFQPPEVRYRIQEDRIMRNGDLRYFDHPKFGLIAKLTLVEETLPGEEEELPADDSATLLPAGSAF